MIFYTRPRGIFRLLMAGLAIAFGAGPVMAQNKAPSPAQSPAQFHFPLQSTAPVKSLPPAEKKAIEGIVREYILNNPEVIIEAIQGLRERDQQQARKRVRKTLVSRRGELLNDPLTPVGGNPKGDVTIVEFFDYRCGYCKRVFPAIQELLNTDGNIRYVFKEFPILGPDSVTAAKVALAVWKIDKEKYEPFHKAMMPTKGALTESRIMRIAAGVGLDVKALKKAMLGPDIAALIEKNFALAQALDINGTPAFVIGDEVVRGAIDLAALKQLVSQARGS